MNRDDLSWPMRRYRERVSQRLAHVDRSLRDRNAAAAHHGFTLVELLVTITIIAILASIGMAGLAVTRQSSRVSKTKATIAKLNNIIMTKWESYRTRRVPLSDGDIHTIAVNYYGHPTAQPVPPPMSALIKLRALRDIMRMEMPERWTDITNSSTILKVPGTPPTSMQRTSLSQAYYARCYSGTTFLPTPPTSTDDHYESAKCLYLVVTMAGGEDARRQIHESEIAEDPTDHFRYFVDGWGHAIRFLRWAPGFNDSDVQASNIPNPPPGWDAPTRRSCVRSRGRRRYMGQLERYDDPERCPEQEGPVCPARP